MPDYGQPPGGTHEVARKLGIVLAETKLKTMGVILVLTKMKPIGSAFGDHVRDRGQAASTWAKCPFCWPDCSRAQSISQRPYHCPLSPRPWFSLCLPPLVGKGTQQEVGRAASLSSELRSQVTSGQEALGFHQPEAVAEQSLQPGLWELPGGGTMWVISTGLSPLLINSRSDSGPELSIPS